MVICPKCHGSGLVQWDHDNGKCYCCNGSGEISAQKQAYYNRKKQEIENNRVARTEANKIKLENEKQAEKEQYVQDKENGLEIYVESEFGSKTMKVTLQEYQNILKDIKNDCIFTSCKIIEAITN